MKEEDMKGEPSHPFSGGFKSIGLFHWSEDGLDTWNGQFLAFPRAMQFAPMGQSYRHP